MPLMLAGVTLTVPTAATIKAIEGRISLEEACPWTARAFPGRNLTGVAWPTGFRPIPTRVRVNTLIWPRAASNFARGWFLASSAEAAAIRGVAFGDGTATNPVTLVMSVAGLNSPETTLAPSVYCFPPVPIARRVTQSGGYDNGLYLIPVVDVRYYWWQIACPDLNIDGTTTTWTNLWTLLQSSLGIGSKIFNDTVASDYRLPDVSLNLQGEALPIVLDTISENCGQRIIVGYDGKVSSVGPTTGLAIRQADDAGFPLRTLVSGGDMFNYAL